MKYLIITCITVLACNDLQKKTELSREKGKVLAMSYGAPVDGSGSTTVINSDGGMGFGSTSIHTDEKFMVVFRCEHGVVFSIDRKELWAKLNEGDSVQIDFYEIVNKKGEVKDLDFVDANKLKDGTQK